MNREKIKKIFLWFLAGMVFFGVISRAADSVRVARVQTEAPKQGNLVYELYGSGTVSGKAGKTIFAGEGMRIGKVYKKAGDSVKKGGKIFSYDMESLRKSIKTAERAYESAKIAYEKTGITGEKEGKGAADEALEEFAKEERDLAIEDAQRALDEKIEAVNKEKKEAYETAEQVYQDAKAQMEEEIKKAERETADAESAYQLLKKTEEEIKERIENLRTAVFSGNETAVLDRQRDLLRYYFGDSYDSHTETVKKAEKDWKRAKEDLQDYLMSGEDDKEQEKRLRREVMDTMEAYDLARETDLKLTERMEDYQRALLASNQSAAETSYQLLFQMLYQVKKVDEAAIAAAKKTWGRAQEDEKALREVWETKLAQKEEEREEAETVYEMTQDGSYDYSEETEAEEVAVRKAAREREQEELKQKVKDEEEQEAKKALEVTRKQGSLDTKAAYLTVEEAREKWEALQSVLNTGGVVTAPADGLIMETEVREGLVTTGSERVVLSLHCYQFEAQVAGEELTHFKEGDTITLSRESEKDKEEFEIATISSEDSSGFRKITVLLPEKGYTEGEAISYEAEKESNSFDSCIPITGLRKDNSGSYIFVVMKRNGILGEEEYLMKTAVTVLSKDTKLAAVAERLDRDLQIVVGSNKSVEEKDRVRIYEE